MKQTLYGLVFRYQDEKYGWEDVYSIYVWATSMDEAGKKIKKVYETEQVERVTGFPYEELEDCIVAIVYDEIDEKGGYTTDLVTKEIKKGNK